MSFSINLVTGNVLEISHGNRNSKAEAEAEIKVLARLNGVDSKRLHWFKLSAMRGPTGVRIEIVGSRNLLP
jgi:hypothetical protein